MNGQRSTGHNLANLLEDKNLILRIEFKTPSNKIFHWDYTGKALLDFLQLIRITPTEALYTIIDTHIKLANLSLPMKSDNLGYVNTIITNAIGTSLGPDQKLLKIMHVENSVVFVCETNEREDSISEIREYLSIPLFIQNYATLLSKDADIKEFINNVSSTKIK